jgi:hypothetical protein
MHVRIPMCIALLTAVVGASVAVAGSTASKQRVQIDMKYSGKAWTFVLTPLQAGALARDSGTQSCAQAPDRTVYHDGQETFLSGCLPWTLVGKRGQLVLRSETAWIEAGGPYNIATGTWKVVRGTGQYAGITGGGRMAQMGIAPGTKSVARFQGFVKVP